MDQFISDLTQYTRRLNERNAPFRGVTLCYSADGVGGDVLRWDARLLLRFENFATALRSFDDRWSSSPEDGEAEGSDDALDHAEGWWLSKIELNADLRNILTPVLLRSNLRTLILDRNEFGPGCGLEFLSGVVERNPSLKRLSFHNNPLEEVTGMRRFCVALGEHPSLEHLSLENNAGLGDDAHKLSMLMDACRNLQCFGLTQNHVGSRDAAAVVIEYLANTNAKIVYLRENNFGNDAADLFASALRKNCTLAVADLSGNRFTRSGRLKILNALFNPSSLDAAMASNHATVVYIDECLLKDRLGVINFKGTPKENRRRKVISTLYAASAVGRLGKLLADVPLGVMPDLLARLQSFDVDDVPGGVRRHAAESLRESESDDLEEAFSRRNALTIVFQTLRGWNLLSS